MITLLAMTSVTFITTTFYYRARTLRAEAAVKTSVLELVRLKETLKSLEKAVWKPHGRMPEVQETKLTSG